MAYNYAKQLKALRFKTPFTFRDWDVDQSWLLPPSLHEFMLVGHIAHFVGDTVREMLDLSAIVGTYTEERGYPPYHPGMMVALLLYGYSRDLYSSRQPPACSRMPVSRSYLLSHLIA